MQQGPGQAVAVVLAERADRQFGLGVGDRALDGEQRPLQGLQGQIGGLGVVVLRRQKPGLDKPA